MRSVTVRQATFPFTETPTREVQSGTTTTFSDNLSLPIHRWFRYSAGFSALWARELILQEKLRGRHTVLDPFVGSGTVLIEAESCGVEAIGIEAHPFVARIASAKLHWREKPAFFREFALRILENAKRKRGSVSRYPDLMHKCFPQHTLSRLDTLRRAWEDTADGSPCSELTWLVLTSILRDCSPVGTAQWQYVLPNKSKAKAADPYGAFESKIYTMVGDMAAQQTQVTGSRACFLQGDARSCPQIPKEWADLVITSPPYSNNYDYADATRLEMTFFGEIDSWGDLQEKVRKYILRSCTQHVASLNGQTYEIVSDQLLIPIQSELKQVCRDLERERERHGGKKPYHTMIAAYFQDMAKVLVELRRVTHPDSLICIVVGDSAPYGVYVPVERWLGELALSVGFRSFRFQQIRERNIKWKNRKHRVPLHEGHLWLIG